MKPMSVVEYIKRKNDIIEKHIGIRLVPDDQIQEVEKSKLSIFNDDAACPYCKVFHSCYGCPMNIANNRCAYPNSSYNRATEYFMEDGYLDLTSINNPVYEELKSLIEEFNVSNGFE